MLLEETKNFTINVMGDKTGTNWVGTFSARTRLSHRLELLRDRYYRELIGPDPQHAGERAITQAELVADLKVCLKDAPQWFKDADFGLDLQDDSVLRVVWEECVKIRLDAIKEVQDRANKAEEVLKTLTEDKK